jgi:PLP dependent protein
MDAIITENLAKVRAGIAEAEKKASRVPGSVELVAVSKTYPPEIIRAAVDLGQLVFGESRVQEAKPKMAVLPGRLRWHLIGHLQKNKIRQALPIFELIHGVDSIELLEDIERIAGEVGTFPRVLLQVNVAAETSKFGFVPERLVESMEEILALRRVQVEGLMTIAPLAPSPEFSRKYFAQLRELREELEKIYSVILPNLSMGMSGDYTVAVEEGSTLLRIGTAIFGARNRLGEV